MVDLVKIRKKLKKKKEEDPEAATAQSDRSPAAADSASPARADAAPNADAQAQPAREEGTADRNERVAPAAAEQSGGATKLERFKEQAGRSRQAESVVAAEESETAGGLELLTFAVAGEQYAVDIEHIVEIVTPRAVTRVPNADASIVGIISLRGTIVTLIDVRRKLRHPATADETPETRIVVVERENETVGFVVDRVLRVVKTDPGLLSPHPVLHATESDEAIRGVFHSGGALTILLDLDKLLDHTTQAVAKT